MTELRGFKFVAKLVLVFKKIEIDDKTKYDTFYSNSKAEIIITESDFDDVFEWIYYYFYIKYTKTFRQRFRVDYWFSRWQ